MSSYALGAQEGRCPDGYEAITDAATCAAAVEHLHTNGFGQLPEPSLSQHTRAVQLHDLGKAAIVSAICSGFCIESGY